MGFTQRAFIRDNRAELRDKLYNIGYKDILLNDNFSDFICIKNGKIFYCNINSINILNWLKENGYIDCGENDEIFLAIAAMRDDSDIHQLFITDVDFGIIGTDNKIVKGKVFMCNVEDRYEGVVTPHEFCSTVIPAHKLSVEEIFDYFDSISQGEPYNKLIIGFDPATDKNSDLSIKTIFKVNSGINGENILEKL